MGSLIKRRWATGFYLLRRIDDLSSSRNRKLGCARMMMSTAVNSSVVPWLMLPPLIEEGGGEMVYKFYNLSEDKEESFPKKRSKLDEEMADAKLVGSSHGWLALLNQRNNNNNNHLFLYNPITNRHIKLPPIETLPDHRINLTPDGRGSVSKLILSSSPDDDDDECIAMMIFGLERRLAFCHPCRSSTTEWTPIGELYYYVEDEGMFPRSCLDIVYSSRQKLFFCQTNRPLECWDLADPLSPRIYSSWDFSDADFPAMSMRRPQVRRCVNLVYAEEYNQLFLVMRYVMLRMSPQGSFALPIYFGTYRGWDNSFPYRTIGFHAYKIDFGVEKPQYLEEGSLDGLAMFIGINHSIAISLTPPDSKKQQLSTNCIYYTDSNDFPIPPSSYYGGHDIGIFDYTNTTISPCYSFPLDIESVKRIMPPPLWFTPRHH